MKLIFIGFVAGRFYFIKNQEIKKGYESR